MWWRVREDGALPAIINLLFHARHYFAYLHQSEQHFQYFTVFVWKNIHGKRDYPMYTEMWQENRKH